MNLRVRCCVFGGKKLKNLNGAPKFIISKEVLRNLTRDRFFEISNFLFISERTVCRRMEEYNLSKQNVIEYLYLTDSRISQLW